MSRITIGSTRETPHGGETEPFCSLHENEHHAVLHRARVLDAADVIRHDRTQILPIAALRVKLNPYKGRKTWSRE